MNSCRQLNDYYHSSDDNDSKDDNDDNDCSKKKQNSAQNLGSFGDFHFVFRAERMPNSRRFLFTDSRTYICTYVYTEAQALDTDT